MLVVIHSKIQDENLPMGFLAPNGEFYNVKWGKHEKFAGEYCMRHNLLEEESAWEDEGFGNVLYRDFLVKKKGFMLFRNSKKSIKKPSQKHFEKDHSINHLKKLLNVL